MKPAAPQSSAPLSLQEKLDRISHDRKVLDALRELMRHGLHEGDVVEHCVDGSHGQLVVLRGASEPRTVVQFEDGTQVSFQASDWRRPNQ
jgi:hypothetical protein